MTTDVFECVGGPLHGRRVTMHEGRYFTYTSPNFFDRLLEGTVRYELRRGDDGERRLYHIEPKGILNSLNGETAVDDTIL